MWLGRNDVDVFSCPKDSWVLIYLFLLKGVGFNVNYHFDVEHVQNNTPSVPNNKPSLKISLIPKYIV
jgi:hypothetical protein